MRFFKAVMLVVIALAVTINVYGAGTSESQRVETVTIWYETNLGGAIDKLSAMFAEVDPNIQIEWVKQDASQVTSKLASALAGGLGPDLIIGSQKRLSMGEFQLGAWADLSPYRRNDREFAAVVDALPQSHVDGYTIDGKLWGLPFFVRHVGLFIRESWMNEAGGSVPRDWEELTELAEALTIPGERAGYGIFGASGTTSTAGFQFMYSAPAAGIEYPILDATGKPNFNTDRAKEVARWMYNWQHEAQVTSPNTPQWTHTEFYQGVQAGRVAIGRIGGWNVDSWESQEHPGTDFIVIEYPPMERNQANPNYQYTWNDGIAMNAATDSPEATVAVLKFLLSKDAQEVFLGELASWAREDLDFEALLGDNPRLLYFAESHPFAPDMAWHPNFGVVMEILSKHLNTMMADPSMDPAATMDRAYAEAMEAYNEMQ